MKAYTLKENGGIENLVQKEVPLPTLKRNEALVKVKAIGINPVDAFLRSNSMALADYVNPKPGEDVILGWDVAGVIEKVGENVFGFQQGDEVFGLVNFKGHGKAYAEYTAIDVSQIALKPANISFEEAGAAPLAALTAWQSLVTYGKIKKGDKVLIHGASGGVGHYAVQIAKHFGAFVYGTGATVNKDFILRLGADEFVDYQKEKFEDKVINADIILDSLDSENLSRSFKSLKNGGRIISLITFFEGELKELIKEKNAFAHRLNVESNGEDMKSIASLFERNILKSHISKVYPFDQLPESHREIGTRKMRGKIVIGLNGRQ